MHTSSMHAVEVKVNNHKKFKHMANLSPRHAHTIHDIIDIRIYDREIQTSWYKPQHFTVKPH